MSTNNSDSNDYIRNRLNSEEISTKDLLKEIIDELRILNHKNKKYNIDRTEFTLGA